MNFSEARPETTLRLMDSDPHPRTAIKFLVDIIIKYFDNPRYDRFVVSAQRTAALHPSCVTRDDRTQEANAALHRLCEIIKYEATQRGYRFVIEAADGYHHYYFVGRNL